VEGIFRLLALYLGIFYLLNSTQLKLMGIGLVVECMTFRIRIVDIVIGNPIGSKMADKKLFMS
jgi:hypothetical protein